MRRLVLAGVLLLSAAIPAAVSAHAATSCTPNYDQAPGEVEHPYRCSYGYVTAPDGTRIAVVVSLPARDRTGDPTGDRAGHRYPTLFMMDGYDGGGGALDPNSYGNRYVLVHASIRGTGCSSGQFDLFSWTDAEDGAFLVNQWIPSQHWSNGRVGIIGHSYPGLTGFFTAERIGYDQRLHPHNPRHLTGIAVSGLIDDLYRGITYLGGIPDYGFPLAWTGAARPEQEIAGNLGRYATDTSNCAQNTAARPASDALAPTAASDDPIVNGLTQEQDGPWWWAHSLITYAQYIDAPIHLDQQYQDEQTGPRGGAVLFQALGSLEPSLAKRIVFTNGRHDSAGHVYHADEVAWLNCYVAGIHSDCRPRPCPGATVLAFFETTSTTVRPPLCASSFPFPDTRWTRFYLTGGNRTYLDTSIGPDDYVGPTETGIDQLSDQLYQQAAGRVLSTPVGGELVWSLRARSLTTIMGPLMVDFYASVAGVDTDFFIQMIDRDNATGAEQYLQYGLLRASYASGLDPRLSDYVGRQMYRPYYAYTNPRLLVPGQIDRYRIEVFPLGWVLRPGHSLLLSISAPPLADQLYAWAGAERPPVAVTIYTGPSHPSYLLLPVLPTNPSLSRRAPACGTQEGVRCATPA